MDIIKIEGLGLFTYDTLKKNLDNKLKDLQNRNKNNAHYGIGKNQFKLISKMWVALENFENKK